MRYRVAREILRVLQISEVDIARRIHQHLERGGTFSIRQRFGSGTGFRSWLVLSGLRTFPDEEGLAQLLEPYPPGEYFVTTSGRGLKILKYYFHFGEERSRAEETALEWLWGSQEEFEAGVREALEELRWREPELYQRLLIAFLEQELGIALVTEEQSWEERLLQEECERNPVFRRQLLEAYLRQLGIKEGKEPHPLDEVIATLGKFKKLTRMEKKKEPVGSILREVARELGPAAKELMPLLAPKLMEKLRKLQSLPPDREQASNSQKAPAEPKGK